MAIPNYDALSVRLARLLGDKVASATTDGQITSAQRDIYLNNAIRKWIKIKFEQKDWNALKQYKKEDTGHSLTAGALYDTSALSPLIAYILAVQVKDGTNWFYASPLPPELSNIGQSALSRANSFIVPSATEPKYTFVGLSMYVFPSATFASNSIIIEYIGQHTALAANTGSTDIAIEQMYWDEIVQLALAEAKANTPGADSEAIMNRALGIAKDEMNLAVRSY